MAAAPNSVTTGPTPILDSGALPKKERKTVGSMLTGFFFGILLAVALIQVTKSASAHLNLTLFLLSFVLAIAVHEAGHLCGGWLVAFRFSFISIGPVSLKLEYGRLKMHMRRETMSGGRAGMHIDQIRRLRRKLLIFTAAGPAANLLSAAVIGALLRAPGPATGGMWVWMEARIFMWFSLFLGIANLMPFRVGMLYADGARILMLLTSRARSRRWISITALGNQNDKGMRSKDWKRTWLRTASSMSDGSVDDFTGNWLAYASANDRKDAAVAAQHLERCLSLIRRLGPAMQDVVALEAAVFTAWFRDDPQIAQSWLGQVKKLKAIPQLLRIRSDVALHCVRKEYDFALSRWEEAGNYIEALPATPARKKLQESFLEWRDEIRERQQTAAGVLAATN